MNFIILALKKIEVILALTPLSKKELICKKCGYEFGNGTISVHSLRCSRRLKGMKQKRINKIRRRYRKNSKMCPVCNKPLMFSGGAPSSGVICPKCGEKRIFK